MTHLELHLGQELTHRMSKNTSTDIAAAAAAAAVRTPNGTRKHDIAKQELVGDELGTMST